MVDRPIHRLVRQIRPQLRIHLQLLIPSHPQLQIPSHPHRPIPQSHSVLMLWYKINFTRQDMNGYNLLFLLF